MQFIRNRFDMMIADPTLQGQQQHFVTYIHPEIGMLRIWSCVLLISFAPTLFAQEKPLVFRVGALHPVSKPMIKDGILIVQKGKILAVGTQADVKIPADADIKNIPEAVIIPGLVDTHSHLGVYSRPGVKANSDGNEMSGPVQPGVRAIDAITADDPGIRMATAGGITTANVMPGSGNVIGGQTLYVKLRGSTVEEMKIVDEKSLGGLKMANGENPKGYGRRGQVPVTRMKVAALQREQFIKAKEYLNKLTTHRKKLADGQKADAPERDPNLEPLVEVLEKKRTVHFHCHRADDLLTAIRIAEEFDFELVLQHGTEAYRITDDLAKKKISVSLTLIDSPGGKAETMGLLEETAGILEKAGIRVAFNTDDPVTESRFFLRTASLAVRGGMTEEGALKAITLNPAQMMHLDHRLGSLDAGKDADFVILSGSPFSVYTTVLETYIDGQRVFHRAEPRDLVYQTGGYFFNDLKRIPAVWPLPVPIRQPLIAAVQPAKNLTKLGARYAIKADRIHLGNGKTLINAVILVNEGKIEKVAAVQDIKLDATTPVVYAKEVTPGLIDCFSTCGVSGAWNIPADQDQDEGGDTNQAEVRVVDGYNVNEGLLDYLSSNGVTIIHSLPGRQNVIAGQSGIFRTRAKTTAEATIRPYAGLVINLGELPKEGTGKGPATRMGTAQILRSTFVKAQNYATKQAGDAEKRPPRDLKLEAVAATLDGKVPVIFNANRSDDLLTALRIAEEFKLKPVLSLAAEAFLIRDEIKKHGVPVFVHPTMTRSASSLETLNIMTTNAAMLAAAGIPVAITTGFEGYVPKTRNLRTEAALAAVNGLGVEKAIQSVTLDAAKLLSIDGQYGSIEAGKVADLVLYDGDALENTTHVTRTIMNGRVVFDRDEYLKLPFTRRAIYAIEGNGGAGCCVNVWQ
jgi:imidazolonepropionase-like amidohydrolase